MKKINLRELYPDVYTTDFFVDVTEEVRETIRAAERAEAAYERKMYRYCLLYTSQQGVTHFWRTAGIKHFHLIDTFIFQRNIWIYKRI